MFKFSENIFFHPNGGVVINNHKSIVISDLHIGMEESSLSLTRIQTSHMLKKLDGMIEESKAKRIILNGDIKHGFGKDIKQEWDEIRLFVKSIEERGLNIVVIKGNHDNYIENILGKESKTYVDLGDIYITHGHMNFKPKKLTIIGNEHPIIKIRDEIGTVMRIPVFMYIKELNIIVTPAFNPLSRGSNILELNSRNLMSPVLKNIDINKVIVYAINGNEILYMSTVGDIKSHLK